MSGRSQALRLAPLRLRAKEVRIEQIGNDLWVHPETPPVGVVNEAPERKALA